MSYKYGPSIVTDGLVFYVDASNDNSYPGTGTTWSDLIGGNDGTLTNGPTYNSANGGSIVFDGVNDYVNCGDVLDMGTNSVTVICWVKLTDSTMQSTTRTPFSKASARSFLGRYWFNIQTDTARRGKIRAGFDSGTTVVADGVTDIRDTGWRMITVVWDRLGDLSVYLENTLEASSDISSYSAVNMQSTDNLQIGAYSDVGGNPGAFTWQGNIADTIYYNRALSASEITQNYNALKNRFI
jgi:hypothetical protein